MSRLANAVALKLVRQASPEAIEAVIGEVLLLDRELVRNVYDLSLFLTHAESRKSMGWLFLSV